MRTVAGREIQLVFRPWMNKAVGAFIGLFQRQIVGKSVANLA